MGKRDIEKIMGGSIFKNNQYVNFFSDIANATNEKDVEHIYRNALELEYNVKIEHPFNCDGYLEYLLTDEVNNKSTKLMLITEYKLSMDFSNKLDRAKVLIQVLYYMKKFESNGRQIPNVILIGDKDEVFVMHSNDICEYLDRDLDWDIAPSDAYLKNKELLVELRQNEQINPFIFKINSDFKFKDVCDKIFDLAFNVKRYVRVTDNNMSSIFDYFVNNVLKDKKKLSANEIVHIFMDLMLNPRDAYPHPKKKNILILSNGTEVAINTDSYKAFFDHYTQDYSPSERERFTEVADRLIEDTERRRKGEFYTPTIWVNEAHKMITDQFGEDWKKDYVVWDCAWGTGNLTRDYKFKELYCSTLNEGDLEIGKKYNKPGTVWNEEGTKFQYDFLNDDVEFFEELKKVKEDKGYLEEKDFVGSKLYDLAPSLIRSMLSGKKLLFFINPPYGACSDISLEKGSSKKGMGVTSVNKLMGKYRVGQCARQLYAQFIYRVLMLKNLFALNCQMGLFAPTLLWSGLTYDKLRELMCLSDLSLYSGFMFNASSFSDVSSKWGIGFALYKGSINNTIVNIKELNNDSVFDVGTKVIISVPKKDRAADWVRSIVLPYKKTKNYLYVTSALNVEHNITKDGIKGGVEDKSLFIGGFLNSGNNPKNERMTALYSTMSSNGSCINIVPDSLFCSLSFFTARTLISGSYVNWLNAEDEYMIPDTSNKLYAQWQNDCIVYSLFNGSSQQSSLRNIESNGNIWDIKNEFFFMSLEDINKLADEHNNEEVYDDIKSFGEERYVYKLLQEVELSEDAQAVLDKAIELTKESFKYRDMFNEDHPEYHINTWDAGWYQIKGLLKEYMPEELKEFNEMYKALGDRMRPLVYELGFLKE